MIVKEGKQKLYIARVTNEQPKIIHVETLFAKEVFKGTEHYHIVVI